MQYTVDQLPVVVQSVFTELAARATNILALHGDLGAGKTTLVSSIAKELGVVESIISPTFIIYRIYKIENIRAAEPALPWERLVHIDAYRLEGEEDAKKVHLHELFGDPANLVCIEWPENVGGVVPQGALHATLAYTAGNERTIEFR